MKKNRKTKNNFGVPFSFANRNKKNLKKMKTK